MADPIARELLRRRPEGPADALGVDVSGGDPDALLRWLVTALLVSAPISATLAMGGARALFAAGLGTPRRMAEARWTDRVAALDAGGYARLDEKTATQLGALAEAVRDRWDGDLGRLREAAGRDPAAIRARLTEFKGIGTVGADVFCREAQRAWPELFPFADAKALAAAEKLGLGADAAALAARLDRREDLPRLLTALVGADRAGELEEIHRTAGG